MFRAGLHELTRIVATRLVLTAVFAIAARLVDHFQAVEHIKCTGKNTIVHSVGSVVSIHNIVYNRFSSSCTSALFHPSSLVRTIFTDSSRTFNSNFIGYASVGLGQARPKYNSNNI